MLVIARWGLLVALAMILICRCRRDITQLVTAFCAFLFAIISWYAAEFAVFPSALQKYDAIQLSLGIGCVAMCVASFLAGYFVRRRLAAGNRSLSDHLGTLEHPDQVWNVFLILTFIGFLPLLFIAKGDLLLIAEDAFMPRKRWSSIFQRARYGDLRDAFLELQMFLRAAVLVGSIILFSKDRLQSRLRKLVAASLLVYMVARALNDGARIGVIEVTLPIATAIYWSIPRRLKSWALLLFLPALATVAVIWAIATCVGRDEGRFEWKMAVEARYTGFEMSRELLFLTSNVPDKIPYQYGKTYLAQVVNPIPRFAWTSKPRQDAGLQLAALQGQMNKGEPKLTVAPGLIGEMYWNFGWPGIVIISFGIGWLTCRWDQFGFQNADSMPLFLIYASGLGIIFVSGRSINMSNFYGLFALCGTTLAVDYFSKLKPESSISN